jgi:hypothetical protein
MIVFHKKFLLFPFCAFMANVFDASIYEGSHLIQFSFSATFKTKAAHDFRFHFSFNSLRAQSLQRNSASLVAT